MLTQPPGHSAAGRIVSLTPSGMELAIFRLLLHCHDLLRLRVPYLISALNNV